MFETNNKRIYLCLAHMSGHEQKYINDAFNTNWIAPLGPNVDGFEKDLEEYIENHWNNSSRTTKKRVCALSSGTAAIHLGLIHLGVEEGDEVICQSLTFCASVNPIIYLGAKPIFVDSEADTYNMDPDLVRFAIEDRISKTGRIPKAIIVVHLYGMPAKVDRIMDVANHYGIPVLEDAAEAMGSMYKNQICGTIGQFGVWSFNGNKMITTSGGGALICPDEASKRKTVFYATQAKEPTPYYQHEVVGYNYRLSNISAGIGRGQMFGLNDHIAHHKHVHELYKMSFQDNPMIKVHSNPNDDIDSNYWLTTILISPKAQVKVNGGLSVIKSVTSVGGYPNDNIEQLRVLLDEKGIETRPLWKPLHCMPVYECIHYTNGGKKDFEGDIQVIESPRSTAYVNGVGESLFQRGLCLPSGPCVSDDDVEYIAKIISEHLG